MERETNETKKRTVYVPIDTGRITWALSDSSIRSQARGRWCAITRKGKQVALSINDIADMAITIEHELLKGCISALYHREFNGPTDDKDDEIIQLTEFIHTIAGMNTFADAILSECADTIEDWGVAGSPKSASK